jgi:AbrB family looped-hinge helix DNA binding protein
MALVNGTVDGMRTTIDRGGRIVVPKPIREAMGLMPGRKVDIVFANGRIEIEAAPMEFEVTDDDGWPVIHALEDFPEPDPDIARATLEQLRAEQDAHHV